MNIETSTEANETLGDETMGNQQIVLLNPETLLFDPEVYGLRDRATPAYAAYIADLAAEIKEFEQRQPILVRPGDAEGDFIIIAGQCRVDAISQIGDGALVKAIVETDIDEDAAYRVAIVENEKRRDFTPIERANMYAAIRAKFGWRGSKGTRQLAEYLRKDEATVLQTEKALTLPDETKALLEEGRMSLWTALEVLNTPEPKRKAVVERASEIAGKEAEEKAKNEAAKAGKKGKRPQAANQPAVEIVVNADSAPASAPEGGKSGKTQGGREANAPSASGAKAEKPKITQSHVKKAQRELNATTKQRAPRMTELRDWAQSQSGPAQPALINKFLEGLEQWSSGKLSNKKLAALLDDIADKLPAAKPASKPVAAAATSAAAKHKSTPKKKSAKSASKPASKPASKAASKPANKAAKKQVKK